MAIDLYWDDDDETVMLAVFDKNWTWDDMFETLTTIKKVTDKRDYEIGALVDVTQGISIPGGSIFSPSTRDNAKKMLKMGDEGKGPIAIVGATGMLKTLSKAFGMLDKDAMNDVYFADTIEEAREIMYRRLQTGEVISA